MKSEKCLLVLWKLALLFAGLPLFSAAAPSAVAQVQFSGPTDYAVGGQPLGAGVGDFNGDGKSDLAVVNTADQTVSILLGNGDGTFQPAVTYPCGSFCIFIAVGDFNGDGNLDLAVCNRSGNSVSIFLGNGNGTFQAAVQYDVGASADYIASGDFNNDKKLDLLVSTSGSISILLGNGDGTFRAPVITATPGPANPSTPVAVGDFNGDGNLDVATGNGALGPPTTGNLTILLGNGDGTFQSPLSTSLSVLPGFFATGDLNGDGRLDLAVEGITSVKDCVASLCFTTVTTFVSTLLGNGDGTFGTPATTVEITHFTTDSCFGGGTAEVMALADLNNDGKLDLAVLNQDNNGPCGPQTSFLITLVGNGDGTFQSSGAFGLGLNTTEGAAWLITGDFNGDTLPDVAVSNNSGNSVGILLNTTPSLTLSLTLAGRGSGSVSSQPAVLNCSTSCSGEFAPGTTVTLTAVPNATSIFSGWSGACSGTGNCTVNMNAAQSVTATFTALFPLSVTLAGSGGGAVTSTPAGISCGSTCSASFLSGTAVTLTATPNATSNFTVWSGACSGTGTCSVTMNAAASATATFTLQDFSLSPTSTKLTLQPGAQGTDVVTIAGLNGPFGSAIQLQCAVTGPAPMPTCAFSATSVTPGSSSAASTLTITAPTTAVLLDPAGHRRLSRSLVAFGIPLMFGITLIGGSKKLRRRYWVPGGLLLLVLLQAACGGNGPSNSTGTQQPTNYTVTVSALSGTITHTTQVTVTVQ